MNTEQIAQIEARCEVRTTWTPWPMQCQLPAGHADQRCTVKLEGLGEIAWN